MVDRLEYEVYGFEHRVSGKRSLSSWQFKRFNLQLAASLGPRYWHSCCLDQLFRRYYGQDELRYLVNYTSSPPIIDGMSTSAEWRAAAPAIDQWVMIGSPDKFLNSMRPTTRLSLSGTNKGSTSNTRYRTPNGTSVAQPCWTATTRLLSSISIRTRMGESNAQTDPTDTGADRIFSAIQSAIWAIRDQS